MIRSIAKVRFKKDPTGLRSSTLSALLVAGGIGGWTVNFDDTTGVMYFKHKDTPDVEKAIHVSDAEWVEFAPPERKREEKKGA